jgi:hypothetical protein
MVQRVNASMASGLRCVFLSGNTAIALLAQPPRAAPSCTHISLRALIIVVLNLHFAHDHGLYNLVLALGDLDDLLDEASTKPALEIGDAAIVNM